MIVSLQDEKNNFLKTLGMLAKELTDYVSSSQGGWTIKGFIDINKNIYHLSTDTKIISKILEIQLFPKFQEFANQHGYTIVLTEKQNWYPDLSFVKKSDPSIKFAVDIKTTYRLNEYPNHYNGFTLGSHGEYFRNRKSNKNIQYPYGDYLAHIALGILYTRVIETGMDETKIMKICELDSITSAIKDLSFFVHEKWKIASDRSGSGNTVNIGSIDYIPDILNGNGVFTKLREDIFDEYWINQGVLQVPDTKKKGNFKKLTKLSEFMEFKGLDRNKIYPVKPKRKK